MQFVLLLIVGVVNLYFGLRRRSKNLPLTQQYKENIEKKYVIRDETGLRDFEEFAVIFLGFIIIVSAFALKVMEYMSVQESLQMKLLIGVAVLMVVAYRIVRNSFLQKK